MWRRFAPPPTVAWAMLLGVVLLCLVLLGVALAVQALWGVLVLGAVLWSARRRPGR